MPESKTALYGILAIKDCCRNLELPSSEASVMAMILNQGLPATKLGGIWISDSDAIEKWRRQRVDNGSHKKEPESKNASPPPVMKIGGGKKREFLEKPTRYNQK